MDPHTPALRRGSKPLLNRQELYKQRVNFCCPHCSKEYRTPTWLDNHIKTKHSTRGAQGLSQPLADMIHNRRTIANSAGLLPQSSVAEDPHHFILIRELQATASLLKSFLCRIEDLVVLLQEPNGAHSTARSVNRGPLRDLKRRASSQDLHGQSKRQGISTSASDFPIPQTTDTMLLNGFEIQTPSSVQNPCEGDHGGFDSSEDSLGFARYSSFEQAQGVCLPLSQQATLPSQAPTSGSSPRQRKTRHSQAPKTQCPTGNATRMFQALPRQQQGRLSPCEQLAAYLHGTSPARLVSGYTLREEMEHMANTPLQKSLDLLSNDIGQHASPLGALQQSLDRLGPASQYNFSYAFSQTPQQDDFGDRLGVDQSDFLTLPIQSGEDWEEEGHQIPLGSSFARIDSTCNRP